MSDPMGPLFKPENKDFFVMTNIGANAAFSDASKTNNTLQFTGDQWDKLRMVEPSGTQEMLDAKGKIVLAFTGTTDAAPGQLYMDADIVSKIGYKAPEGGAAAVMIANSDPVFYNPNDYDGDNSNVTGASTSTKVNLIGTAWKKGSMASSQFKQALDEYRAANETEMKKMAFDVFESIASDGTKVEVFIEKKVIVETGASAIVDWRTQEASGSEYSIFTAIGDFMTMNGGASVNLNDTFTDVTGAGPVTLSESPMGGAVAFGDTGDNQVTGTAGRDSVDAGAGDDVIDGGSGADRLTGGEGDDTITGGNDGVKYQTNEAGQAILDGDGNQIPLEVWDWGDRAIFKGKKADYTITANANGTFTVVDDKAGVDGNDGTDTLSGIEIIEFADDNVLLVTKTESYSYTDWATGNTISEEFSKGTDFDDVITGSGGKSFIRGKAGNDVIKGDPSVGGSKDMIEGGAGNDFIDGAGRGQGIMPWENDNVAEYMAAGRRFTVEKLTYKSDSYSRYDADGNLLTDKSDKDYIDSLITSLNMNASAIGALVQAQDYFIVTDSVTDANGGLGTDILTNIDEIIFDDKFMRLSVFKDVWGGFIEGTSFGDTITGEGVDENIMSGDGADRVSGGAGADRAELGKGNDFFDGGSNTKDFDANSYLNAAGFDSNDIGTFNPEEFMNMDMGNAGMDPMAGGMGMDPMVGGMGMDPMMGGGDPNMMGDPNAVLGTGVTTGYTDPAAGGAPMAGGGGHHGGGPIGDAAQYQGDYARFTVKTYAGDSSELAAIVTNKFSDLKGNSSMWVAEKSYTVVTDSNTGKKGLGTDLLVNVETIEFNDFSFNLAITQNIEVGSGTWGGQAHWGGTFGDDEINFNNLDSTGITLQAGEKLPVNDFMSGEAGNDVLISGDGGDRLIGGTGNDIMDGGANGSTGNEWEDNDVAEYKASIDRFTLTKHTFAGKAMVLKDTNGNTVFTVAATKKGTDTLGSIKRAGEDKAALTIKEGDTFYLVSDSLPEQYGGEGTDILLNMEQAQFGFDWDGTINFQVKHHVDQYGGMAGHGGTSGMVNTEGTIFNDVIDLRAGKKSTDSGFGGFNDFNTGMDIWDAGFHAAADANLTAATGGFDKWNWAPGKGDTAVASGVSSLESAYAGDSAISGTFDIYKVSPDPQDASKDIYLAYDTTNNWVAEEVKSNGSGGWKVTYAGVAANATVNDLNTAAASDWQAWQPSSSDTPTATGKTITYDDGFTTPETFDIYEYKTGEFLAYRKDGDFGYVHDLVVLNADGQTWNNKKPDDQFKFTDTPAGGLDWGWMPSESDTKLDLDGDSQTEVTSIWWKGHGGGSDFEVTGKWDIYQYKTDTYVAFNTEFQFLDNQVEWDSSANKYFFKDIVAETAVTASPPSGYPSLGNVQSNETRIHDSFIRGGRGNDIILAGQGRDEIEGGLGDDFIDGGSESDFLAELGSAIATNQFISNPDTGLTKKYDVYREGDSQANYKYWAWDGNKTNPNYFEVQPAPGGSTYEAKQVTINNEFYNDRFSSYDRAIYSGSKERYEISEVYLKMEAGRPDLANDGSYQEITIAAYQALSNTKKADYTKVVKIKDVLPALAGGEGTDYLLNIEEVNFEDGFEQLEVDSWGWPEQNMISYDPMWTPAGGWANATPDKTGVSQVKESWGGFQQYHGDQSGWSLYAYKENGSTKTISDGGATKDVYALVRKEGNDLDGFFYMIEKLVVIDGNESLANASNFKEATETKYTGTFRGTIKDDQIGHVNNPSKDQADEIFGKGGNDLVVAGAGVDRIKGGTGDDTIWGGAHAGGEQWQFAGDVAFYAGSIGRYDVIQNVYVKAASENGAVERDASGNAVIYYSDSTAKKGLGFANGYVDGISKLQKVGSDGALGLDGGLVSSNAVALGVAQQISITSSGNDSNKYFWIVGTDASDSAQTVKLQGANTGVATTTETFKTITSISVKDGNSNSASATSATGKVKAGTSHKIADSSLTKSNGFYEAVVVVDSLSDSQGGDGSDVLIGVEGLIFSHSSGGTHDWLNHVDKHSSDLTKLSVTYMAEDFQRPDWVEGDADAVSTNGTALVGGGPVVLGSAGRFIEITRTGGDTGNVTYTITGDIKGFGHNAQVQTNQTRDITVGNDGVAQGWDLFTKVTAIAVKEGSNAASGNVTIGTASGDYDTQNFRVLYTGTNFDDEIYYNNQTSFTSEVGTAFALNQVTDMGFMGGQGDDNMYGTQSSNSATPKIRDSYAIYTGDSSEYEITLNKTGSTLNSVTVKHKVDNSAGGTGTDTLYNINKAIFGFQSNAEQIVNFLPEIKSLKEFDQQANAEITTGVKIVSTLYDDTVTAANYVKNSSQNAAFEAIGSGTNGNTFTGRVDTGSTTFGKDVVVLPGVMTRYDIRYKVASDEWKITDLLAANKGGAGTTKAVDIEGIAYDENFSLDIGKLFDGVDDSTNTGVKLHNGNDGFNFSTFSQLSGVDSNGYAALLSATGADDDSLVSGSKNAGQAWQASDLTGAGNLFTIGSFDNFAGKFVTFKSDGDESNTTFTIVGVDRAGGSQTETVNGTTAGNVAVSAFEYKSITSITVGGQNTAGTVKIGHMNSMIVPDSWETFDHDDDPGTSKIQLTPAHLFGQAQTFDADTVLGGIDGADNVLQKSEWEAALGSSSHSSGPLQTLFQTGGNFLEASYGTYDSNKNFNYHYDPHSAPASSDVKLNLYIKGLALDDSLYGSGYNETFVGRGGDDVIWGRGEEVANSWDIWNTGDSVEYNGHYSRYTISSEQTDTNSDGDSSTWDNTGITTTAWSAWLSENSLAANIAPKYFTVTDSLGKLYGGDGVDTLVDIEKIRFMSGKEDVTYFLEIRTLSDGNSMHQEIIGTSGADNFTSYTDDTAGGAADKDYYIQGGKGNDIIVGGVQPANKGFVWGDTAVYDSKAKYFDISVKEMEFKLDGSNNVIAWGDLAKDDWDGDGDSDSADLTLAGTLFARFATVSAPRINQITVKDTRAAAGEEKDILYGVEHLEFRSGMEGDMYDIEPSISRDGSGQIIDFWGTNFADVFNGDDGSTWVNAQGGDDVIVAGNGADTIQPGAGADYVHGGLNNNSGGGGNSSWFRDEANFWDAPFSRTEVQQVKVMVNADTGLMTHTSDDQFIVYGYTGEAARVEDYEEDVSINDTVKTFDSSTIVATGADDDSIATGTNTSGQGILAINGAYNDSGTAKLGSGKYVSITSDADETGINFKVTGKDYYGADQVETIAGGAGTIKGTKIFSTVTEIEASADTQGTVKAGTVSNFTWMDAFLVTDTLPGTETGSIGLNVLVDIEAIGFSDDFLEVKPFSDTWTFTDWFTGETISESFKEGTPFDDTNLSGGSGTDTLSGNGGDDLLTGLGGGDRLKGGKGHDILDGGANGTSGDTWRDLDMAEYSGIEARYKVFTVKVNASSLTPGSQTIYDVSGQLEADSEIYSSGTFNLEGFDVVKQSGTSTGMTTTAYIIADMLPANMGGSGNDLLLNVEMVQFKESSIDLGLRIERNDWDGNSTNGYDWVEVRGTDGADTITNWGTGSYLDSDLDDDCISVNASVGDASNLVLGGDKASGGKVTLNQAHKIIITSAGDDTDRTFKITGTDSKGNVQTEDVTGANNGVATSTKSFLTITEISATGTDSTANIKVGVAAATSATSEDAAGDNEIRGKGGDDIIFGYAGGDRISGDGGNDFIDGGADGAAQFGWVPKDMAVYAGASKNYTITTYTKTDSALTSLMSDLNMTISNWSSYADDQKFVVVKDSLPSVMGGSGTDILTNVEFIEFQDQSLPLSMEEFIDVDPSTGLEVRRAVTGTSSADKIEGGAGNDDLFGNGGNDTITGGVGGDYIKPGAGNDTIDGGADGTDIWSGEAVFDRVIFDGNYADYEIEDADVSGVLTITVTDTDPNGEGVNTITNVEILEFADQHVFVGTTKNQIKFWDPSTQSEVAKGFFVTGSIFGDTIGKTGTSGENLSSDSADEIFGGKGSDTIYGKDGPDFIKGGQGNDTIYGGGNGLDEWGNPGDDVAVFSGNEARYTVSYFDSAGNASSSGYQSDGYVKVVDSSTDESVTEGTDTLWGIEGIQFADGYLGFKKVETFIDLDGDGKPDVGGKKGTSGNDKIDGSDMDEKIEGAKGDDVFHAGKGDDFLDGGEGADTLIGGVGHDIAGFAGSMANYTIAAASKWIGVKTNSDGSISYEKDANGETKIFTSSSVGTGFTSVQGYTVTTKDADADGKISSSETTDVTDLVFEVESFQFEDGFGRASMEIIVDDFDFDFQIDFSEVLGSMGADTIKASNSAIDTLLGNQTDTAWLSGASLDKSHVFAANNFIDGGAGNDDIDAGAGDDYIDPGARSGDQGDKVDGGAGNDTMRLFGKQADWTIAGSPESSGDFNTYTKYTHKNGTDDDTSDDIIVYAKNIEGIDFDDIYVSASATAVTTEVDEDGDGKVDKVVTTGASGSAADTAVANVGDNKAATGLSDLEDLDVSSDATLDLTTGTANEAALGASGQYVTIESTADETANFFTVVGTDINDVAQTEVIYGANAAVATGTKAFKTITSVTANADTSGSGVKAGLVSGFTVQEDVVDAGAGDDVASTGDGADTIIDGAGSDFYFGGANRGTDENGEANKDVAVFNGRSTSVDLNGDGSIGEGEKADYTVAQNGFMVCNGIIDASGQCILTTLEGTTTTGSVDGISQNATLSGAATMTINGSLNASGTAQFNGGANVKITSASDDTGITFTVKGTDLAGNALTEVIKGANGAAATGSKTFATVTEIKSSGATAGNVSAGVTDILSTSEKQITDDQISATLKPTIFSAVSTAVAVTVAKGTDANGDGVEDTFEVAGAVNGIAMVQNLSGGGAQNLTINGDEASGGNVKLMKSQNVKIKSAGNDSSITFTVTGTDDAGNALTEVITGSNASTAYGIKEFKTITQIQASGNTAGNIEAGLSSFYLDVDGDSKADTLTNGKIVKDLDGDGKYTGTGEYEISLTSAMNVDEIFVCTLDKTGDGSGAGKAAVTNYQIFDGHEIRPVYEVSKVGSSEKDIVVEIEALEFNDGIMELTPQTEETVTFDLSTGITELVNQVGSNFADEILSTAKSDIMNGGGGADNFVFGTATGTDRIKDFVAKNVDADSDGTVDSYADVIKVLKNVNSESIETAANVLSRVTSTTDGALINLGGGNTILLEGVNSDTLTAANFMVVEVL